jgi:hypothetical protein
MWVELICDDESIIEENIRETKLTSPDYAGVEPEAAVRLVLNLKLFAAKEWGNRLLTFDNALRSTRRVILQSAMFLLLM